MKRGEFEQLILRTIHVHGTVSILEETPVIIEHDLTVTLPDYAAESSSIPEATNVPLTLISSSGRSFESLFMSVRWLGGTV